MGEIASASTEQTSGIEQINKAIAQMDHVVQMNASLVEQATAAAASMATQAGDLARSVARFRVTGEEPGIEEPGIRVQELGIRESKALHFLTANT